MWKLADESRALLADARQQNAGKVFDGVFAYSEFTFSQPNIILAMSPKMFEWVLLAEARGNKAATKCLRMCSRRCYLRAKFLGRIDTRRVFDLRLLPYFIACSFISTCMLRRWICQTYFDEGKRFQFEHLINVLIVFN